MTVDETNAAEVAQITKDLLAPFEAGEVKFKPGKISSNRALALAYIDSRLVMDRLDDVVGIDGWRDEYTVLPNGEVECRLSLKIAGVWITKADVGGQSEQPDEGDRMKAAYSDALKRAAVKFGIGRFLYRSSNAWHDFDPVKKTFAYPLALLPDGKIVARGSSADQKPAQPKPNPDQPPEIVVNHERALAAASKVSEAEVNEVIAAIRADKLAGKIDQRGAVYLRGAAADALRPFQKQPA